MRPATHSRVKPITGPCPNCRRLVSLNAETCLHCGFAHPGRLHRLPLFSRLLSGKLILHDQIILACFVLYVLGMALDLPNAMRWGGIFDSFGPSGEALYRLGMGGRFPLFAGRVWTLVTATYLHSGILHLAFNMLWLRSLGPVVEELYGASRFLIIYTLAGLAGGLLTSLLGTFFFVGASGAVFGLFGALIYYGYRRGGTFGRGIFRQMLVWAAAGFVLGFAVPNVDNWGHLGGLVGGLLAGWGLDYNERQPAKLSHHLAALSLLAVIILSFFLVFLEKLPWGFL